MATIVLDPGHGGGRDLPGSSANNARGPGGTLEKDLTLAVAGAVRDAIAERHQVLLTRNVDTNVAAADRAAVARDAQADVFLSIHFNAFQDPDVQGTETLVRKSGTENTAEVEPSSKVLAQNIQSALVEKLGLPNRGLKVGRWIVLSDQLHHPSTARCLAEISFLTDPREEERLSHPQYIDGIGHALAGAIEDFLDAQAQDTAQAFYSDTYSETDYPVNGGYDPDAYGSPSRAPARRNGSTNGSRRASKRYGRATAARMGGRTDVARLQGLLNKVGGLLKVDGVLASATRTAVAEARKLAGLPEGTEADQALTSWLEDQPPPSPDLPTEGVTFIAREEVGSRRTYDRVAAMPHWPKGESGITIGVGYDLRFSDDTFEADWGDKLPEETLAALRPHLGKTGSSASAEALNWIRVPWASAWQVFIGRSLPAHVEQTKTAFTTFGELPDLCRSALVSLVLNRGAWIDDSDSRREIRTIRDLLLRGDLAGVPDQLLSMRRLWPDNEGLRDRREREAKLWKKGLEAVESAIAKALASDELQLGQKVPNKSERDAVGRIATRIRRGTPEFATLIRNTNPNIVFKNEEVDDSDLMMTENLRAAADTLADLVAAEWPGVKLRVTEAWDGQDEHSQGSMHYEARALDFTTDPRDPSKYGRLAKLAVEAGFDWVWYEDRYHVHASVRK